MTVAEVRSRVVKGAALLDEMRPGWADQINLLDLDLRRCDRCILGQIYGDYGKAVEVDFRDTWATHGFALQPFTEYGSMHDDKYERGYSLLADTWREAIDDRLAPTVEWTTRELVTA